MRWFINLFRGRINRRTYLLGLVGILAAIGIIISVLLFFDSFKGNSTAITPNSNTVILLLVILFDLSELALVIFVCSLNVRRLHDLGYSGWLSLCYFLPILNLIGFLLLFKGGEQKENKYGKPPKPQIDIQALLGLS